MNAPAPTSRSKILDAALLVIRSKGYTASTIDDICAAAGVTKGSFFHHFAGKVDLALAAVEYWNTTTGNLFAGAPYQDIADPRDRVLAYIDFRKALIQGETPAFTCLLGTMVQETFETYPNIRDACGEGIVRHAHTVAGPLEQAKARYAPDADWDPEKLALYTQAVLQGAYILAKAQNNAEVALTCVDQLRSHVANLLNGATEQRTTEKPKPKRSKS